MNLPVQEFYTGEAAVCYGCGRLNEYGHQIKSFWKNGISECTFQPKPYHTAITGYVYGGLLASLIDCHSTGTAALAMYDHQGRKPGTDPELRFVTASLHVNYLKPTPIDGPLLIIQSHAKEIGTRKVIVVSELYAKDILCVTGEVVAVLAPDSLFSK
jgi:acyl-coenzyme A thioesterase PaaI-like protein